ncbi:MAG: DnaJ domain-containing protein [Pyrinomonadaceae bacterium]
MGAGKTASHDEIERLYKRLARQHHPDPGGDAELMKAINEAYRMLGNEDLRRLYDLQIPRASNLWDRWCRLCRRPQHYCPKL